MIKINQFAMMVCLLLVTSCGQDPQANAVLCKAELEKSSVNLTTPDSGAIWNVCRSTAEKSLRASTIYQSSKRDLEVSGLLLGTKSITLLTGEKINLSGVVVTPKLQIKTVNLEVTGKILVSENASIACDKCDYDKGQFFGSGAWVINGRVCQIGNDHRLVCSLSTTKQLEVLEEKLLLRMLPDPATKKYVYIHVADINNWFELLEEIIRKIENSGLYDAVSEIRIGYLGSQSNLDKLRNYMSTRSKVKIRAFAASSSIYERITLGALHEDSQNEDFYALYLHVKGVTKYGTPLYENVIRWVDYMHYFLIDKHQSCVSFLAQKNIDTVGVNMQSAPELHYSGNMWWVKSTYLRSLPAKIGPAYLDPEMWVLSNSGDFLSLFTTYVDHYKQPYPRENYIGKEEIFTLISR